MNESELKQYKSCADCYHYEFASRYDEGYCTLGFPLEKLAEPVVRTARFGHDTLFFEHKPKFGCVQKDYHGSPKFDFMEAIKTAQKLQDKE